MITFNNGLGPLRHNQEGDSWERVGLHGGCVGCGFSLVEFQKPLLVNYHTVIRV